MTAIRALILPSRRLAPSFGLAVAIVVVSTTAADAALLARTTAGRGIGDGRLATEAALAEPSDVTVDGDGGILVADRLHHRIRRIDPETERITTIAGTLQGILGDGLPATRAELKHPVSVSLRSAGGMLVAEQASHRVRLIGPDGITATLAGIADAPGTGAEGVLATASALRMPYDAAEAPDGTVWIADFDNHRIRRVLADGTIVTRFGTGTPGFLGDGGAPGAARFRAPRCILPAAGNVFYICDWDNHVIRRVQANVITTIAGVPEQGGFTGDGPATTVQLRRPEAVALDGSTGLWIADTGNHRIRHLDFATGELTTVAGTGVAGFTDDGAEAATSALDTPRGLVALADGRVAFAEAGSHRVRVLDDGVLATVAGDGIALFGGDGGPAVDATLFQVKSAAIDADGNLYVPDAGNNRIRRIDAASGEITTIAGTGATTPLGDGGPAIAAGMANPSDVVVDADGNVIFSDTDGDRVRRIDASGTISTIAGTGAPGYTGDGGQADVAQLNHPTGLELDVDGNLYIADFRNHVIRRVAPDGTITTVAGNGIAGAAGDDGAATAASLTTPTDLEIDAEGNLIIADFGNHRVRRVVAATGIITTIAGSGLAGSSGDGGLATLARLRLPSDVAFDAAGNLLIADFGNHRVRRVDGDGVIATVAGTGAPGGAGDGGPASAAQLEGPLRLLVLPGGRVLVAERDGSRLRELVADTDDDGIPDPEDICPEDADPNQEDGDGDGFGDACDPCPQTPVGAPPSSDGCACIDGTCECPDGDADTVCDETDNCPEVPNHDQADTDADGVGDACEDAPPPDGGITCAGGQPECIAGGGAKRTDCLVELHVAGTAGTRRRATCRDGNGACDFDAAAGQCTFQVAVCFGVGDARLPRCQPEPVTSFALAKPGPRSRKAEKRQAAQALAGVVASRTGGATPAGSGADCTDAADIVVPLRGRRRGKLAFRFTGATAAGGRRGRDKDKVVLVCAPG